MPAPTNGIRAELTLPGAMGDVTLAAWKAVHEPHAKTWVMHGRHPYNGLVAKYCCGCGETVDGIGPEYYEVTK